VRATTSTAAIDLSHFHHYCYAERNGNTPACRVPTRVNAPRMSPDANKLAATRH
jgi:hypothetical protein